MTGKQLKDSILQWAIQGKLVPQDPNDEPASVLLQRIREEKARLIKEKKIKKPKTESFIFRGEDNSYYEKFSDGKVVCIDEEIPFELPKGWEWCRLGNVAEYRKGPFGSSLTKSMFIPKGNDSVKVYEQKNAIQKDYKLGNYYISKKKFETMQSFIVNPGDIIVSCAGTIGESYIMPTEAPVGIINQALMRVTPYLNQISEYWLLCFEYILLANSQMKGAGSAIKNIPPFDILKALIIPLPPLAEQYRIIEKITEVKELINKYNTSKQDLDKLNDSIKNLLKKSILQEAIQGRLVPQNPDDEPACELLKRIREEKERLIKEKKIKADKNESIIFRGDDNSYYEQFEDGSVVNINDELGFLIPANWEIVRLGDLVWNMSGLTYKKENLEEKAEKYIRVLRGGNINEGSWVVKDDDVMIAAKFVKDDLILKAGTFITPAVSSFEQIGKTALIEEDTENIAVGGFVLMLIPFVMDKILLSYLQYYFQTQMYKNSCQQITNKSGQAFYNLSRTKLMNTYLPLPPIAEQYRIVQKLKELFAQLK